MRILHIGALHNGSNSTSMRDAFISLGHEVASIDPEAQFTLNTSVSAKLLRRVRRYRPFSSQRKAGLPMVRGMRTLLNDLFPESIIESVNSAIQALATNFKPDFTFLFHDHYISADTLRLTHQYGPNFCFFPDDPFTPERYTWRAAATLQEVDFVMTTKSFSVKELTSIGVPNVVFVNNSYAPDCHHPVTLDDDERERYGGDVAFVGNCYSAKRADFIAQLADALPDVRFSVWGTHWSMLKDRKRWYKNRRWQTWPALYPSTHGAAWCEPMSKVFASSKICLGLLYPGDTSKRIRDYQTTRSVEIPACGGFMLAEYTDEHNAMFAEGKEAAYFRSLDDAVEKIKYYLAHEDERKAIAAAGHAKCLNGPNRFIDRAREITEAYEQMQRGVLSRRIYHR